MRRVASAGAIAAACALLGVGGGVTAVAGDRRAALHEDGGRTPIAKAGTALAARSSIGRAELHRRLRSRLNSVGGTSGAYVLDLSARRRAVLFSAAGESARILASNTKLFTTAAYLARFGGDGTRVTRVYERGRRSGRRDRVLEGSLALVGDGDPALASARFAESHNLPLTSLAALARTVRKAGIRRVKGNVRADETIFDDRRSVRQTGITGGPFLSPLSGLSYNSGFEDGRHTRNPPRAAGRAFIAALAEAGVRVTGRVRVGRTPGKVRADGPLGRVASPTTAALIRRTNRPSNNFFAEMLLKRLAAGANMRGTTERGVRRVRRFARSIGSGVWMENGSGLSRRNIASPRNVVRLLTRMARSRRHSVPFRRSLAVAGRSGTLRDRMRGTAAAGRCRGKTGTLDGVSALSGYCRTARGLVAFSLLMNGVSVDAARRAQDAMVAAIARYG